MKLYYINPAGTDEKLGPLAEEDLIEAIKEGRYSRDSLVWCEGMTDWAPAYSVFPQDMPPMPGSVPPSLPSNGPVGPEPPSHLVSAIISAAVWFFFCFPGCVLGIIAIVKDLQAKQLWREGRQREAENTANEAAKLANWGIGLIAIPILVFLLLFLVSVIFGA